MPNIVGYTPSNAEAVNALATLGADRKKVGEIQEAVQKLISHATDVKDLVLGETALSDRIGKLDVQLAQIEKETEEEMKALATLFGEVGGSAEMQRQMVEESKQEMREVVDADREKLTKMLNDVRDQILAKAAPDSTQSLTSQYEKVRGLEPLYGAAAREAAENYLEMHAEQAEVLAAVETELMARDYPSDDVRDRKIAGAKKGVETFLGTLNRSSPFFTKQVIEAFNGDALTQTERTALKADPRKALKDINNTDMRMTLWFEGEENAIEYFGKFEDLPPEHEVNVRLRDNKRIRDAKKRLPPKLLVACERLNEGMWVKGKLDGTPVKTVLIEGQKGTPVTVKTTWKEGNVDHEDTKVYATTTAASYPDGILPPDQLVNDVLLKIQSKDLDVNTERPAAPPAAAAAAA
jgi:hypothetical protein